MQSSGNIIASSNIQQWHYWLRSTDLAVPSGGDIIDAGYRPGGNIYRLRVWWRSTDIAAPSSGDIIDAGDTDLAATSSGYVFDEGAQIYQRLLAVTLLMLEIQI